MPQDEPGEQPPDAQARHAHYRVFWPRPDDGAPVERVTHIPDAARSAILIREKSSHRGIGTRRDLRRLIAGAANQDFLDEICELEDLEELNLLYPMTAKDLSGLRRLRRLKALRIDSPRNVTDFTPLTELPALTSLFLENAKNMNDLDWLAPLKDRLLALGIEGSMWTMQSLPGLAPLSGFSFEALFLTSVRLKDKDLVPLATCPNLRYLNCARFAPKVEFERLKELRPDIDCSWFERYEI